MKVAINIKSSIMDLTKLILFLSLKEKETGKFYFKNSIDNFIVDIIVK